MLDMKLLNIIQDKTEHLTTIFSERKVPTVLDDMLCNYIVLHDLPAYVFRMTARDQLTLYYMRSPKDKLHIVVFEAYVPLTLKPVKRARIQRRSR